MDGYDPTGIIGPTQRPGEPSILDYAKALAGGGIYGGLKQAGVQTPSWMDAVASIAQNPDLNAAVGMAAPVVPPGFQGNLRALVAKGLSNQKIADQLGVGKATVQRHIDKLGLPVNPTSVEAGAWSDPQNVALLQSMLKQGASTRDIAAAVGSSSGGVTQKVQRMGLNPANPPGFPGAKQGYQPSLPNFSLPDVGPGDPWLMQQLGYK